MVTSDSTSILDKLHALEARIAELETKPQLTQFENDVKHDEKEEIDIIVDYGSRRERLRKAFDWEMERLHLREEEDLRRRDRATNASKSSSYLEDADEMPRARRDPVVRSVAWSSFKQLSRPGDLSLCAVDILIGEPVVYDNMGLSGGLIRLPEQRRRPLQSIAAIGKQFPERIRVHSELVPVILDKIINSPGNKQMPSDSRPVVFTRPFKTLTYCEAGLRRWCTALKEETCAALIDRKPLDQSGLDNQPDDMDDSGSDDESSKDSNAIWMDDLQTIKRFPKSFEELNFVLKVLESEVLHRRRYLNGCSCRQIFFSDLWHLFRPGTEVIRSDGKQVYRVLHVASAKHRMLSALQRWAALPYHPDEQKEARPDFRLTCIYIDYDGSKLGPVLQSFDFKPFEGERDVRSLVVFPLRLHSVLRTTGLDSGWNSQSVETPTDNLWYRQKLITRGLKFLKAIEGRHMQYAGPTIDAEDEVEGEVMVDFEAAFGLETGSDLQHEKPKVAALSSLSMDDYATESDCQFGCCDKEYVHDDTHVDKLQSVEYIDSLMPKNGSGEAPSVIIQPQTLSELKLATSSAHPALQNDEVIILSYRVFAFVLRSRRWAQLDLEFLTDIQRMGSGADRAEDMLPVGHDENTEQPGKRVKSVSALDRLVLPSGHKSMIVALISQHLRTKEVRGDPGSQFDMIRGKGKGLMLMLHGPPGVGKTSTAEGVADRFEKPLFQVTCGDLGSTPKELEKSLDTSFTLAARWDCILLIDEADVFLRSRDREGQHNGFVAVFLRVLEYFPGILFLTSNRVGDFDRAFMSRIHVTLYYPSFTLEQTLDVLEANLNLIEGRFAHTGRKISIDRNDITELAKRHFTEQEFARWNGRQIRNACQTALALAEFEAEDENHHLASSEVPIQLSKRHFQLVDDAYTDFADYMSVLYGAPEAIEAKEGRVRVDLWQKPSERNDDADMRSMYTRHRYRGWEPVDAPMPYEPATYQVPYQGRYDTPYNSFTAQGWQPGLPSQQIVQGTSDAGPPDDKRSISASQQNQRHPRLGFSSNITNSKPSVGPMERPSTPKSNSAVGSRPGVQRSRIPLPTSTENSTNRQT